MESALRPKQTSLSTRARTIKRRSCRSVEERQRWVTFSQRVLRQQLFLRLEQQPELIISDIGMPGVDGYELMRALRSTPGLEQVPAIALTGYARDEDRELALAAGYNAHISKPANMSRLLYLIKKLTGDKQS